MAKLPSVKRLVREDIPNAPEWIDTLIDPLNTFMEEVYYALDRDLTLNENIIGGVSTIQFKTRSDYTTAVDPLDGWEIQKLFDPISVKPEFVGIGQITDRDEFTIITAPVSLSWDWLDGEVRIKYIAGLTDSKRYEIKLLIF